MAEVIVSEKIEPAVGMILIDEHSQTWEITGTLHDSRRTTDTENSKLWTLQCTPVNAEREIQPGELS